MTVLELKDALRFRDGIQNTVTNSYKFDDQNPDLLRDFPQRKTKKSKLFDTVKVYKRHQFVYSSEEIVVRNYSNMGNGIFYSKENIQKVYPEPSDLWNILINPNDEEYTPRNRYVPVQKNSARIEEEKFLEEEQPEIEDNLRFSSSKGSTQGSM